MFSLHDLRFVLCSLEVDIQRAQRIMGFFILIIHKSTRSENPIRWRARQESNKSSRYERGVSGKELRYQRLTLNGAVHKPGTGEY